MYTSPTNLMGRFNMWASKMMFKPIWGQIAGALISGSMASSSARKAESAAEERDRLAYERSKPRDVKGLFGSATFDPETQAVDYGLSEDWQAQYDQYLADSARQKGYLGEIEGDPWATADKFYQQKAAMFEPRFEEQRLDEEKRLLAQGRLGGTGGQKQYGTLLDTQADLRSKEQMAAYDQAQQMIDAYRKRQAEGLGAAERIGAFPEEYGATGINIGSTMGGAGRLGDVSQASRDRTDASAGMWGNIGSTIGGYKGNWGDLFGNSGSGGTPGYTMIDGVGVSNF